MICEREIMKTLPSCSYQLFILTCHLDINIGGMIACKLAALAPERVKSLAMLNVTGGGFQCCPKVSE